MYIKQIPVLTFPPKGRSDGSFDRRAIPRQLVETAPVRVHFKTHISML